MRTIFSLCCAFALTTACATVRPVPLTLLAASPTWEEQRAAELRSFWGDESATGMDGDGPHLFFVDADDPCLRPLVRRFTEALDGAIAADEYRGAAIELSAADLEHARNRDGGWLIPGNASTVASQILLKLASDRQSFHLEFWWVVLRIKDGSYQYLGHGVGTNPFGDHTRSAIPLGCMRVPPLQPRAASR